MIRRPEQRRSAHRRPTTRTVLAALALVAGSVALAAPAKAATYGVTLTASHAQRDVGQKLTLSGKVSGAKAAGKKLAVQRRVGTGAWRTIATPRTTKTRTFSSRVTVSRTGTQQYRVVAPAAGSTQRGVSPARTVTGWTWLDLYDESYYSSGGVQRGWVGTVNGGTPPRETLGLYSSDGNAGSHGFVGWRSEGQCDRVTAAIGMSDGDSTAKYVRLEAGGPAQLLEVQPSEITKVDVPLVDDAGFSLRRFEGSGGGYVVVESPRAHCRVDRMPIAYD